MYASNCSRPTTEPMVLKSLQMQIAKALGPNVGVVCSGVDGDPDSLWPVEREAILRAVPQRQREFSAGRSAAREAMIQINWQPEAIPSAPDRSPVWPKGLVGSITHGGHVCVAITGLQDQVHALGIDIEEDLPVNSALWQTICTHREFATLVASIPRSEQGQWVTRLFCAKEAFYKWQYPQTGRVLDFCDVQVTFNQKHAGFSVHSVVPGNSQVPSYQGEGNLLTYNGLVIAWLMGPLASHLGGQ